MGVRRPEKKRIVKALKSGGEEQRGERRWQERRREENGEREREREKGEERERETSSVPWIAPSASHY